MTTGASSMLAVFLFMSLGAFARAEIAGASKTQIQYFASTNGTCTGKHGDLSSGSVFTTTATANSCHSYADHTPSYPSTWATHGKYVKFVCSGTNVELFGLCSEGCATSTCQEIKTFKPEEVVGKCLEQTTTGYPDYKIIEMKLPCDASSATTSATTSYLASACTVVAFMLLQT